MSTPDLTEETEPDYEEGDYSEYTVYIDRSHEEAFRTALEQFAGHIETEWKDWHSV